MTCTTVSGTERYLADTPPCMKPRRKAGIEASMYSVRRGLSPLLGLYSSEDGDNIDRLIFIAKQGRKAATAIDRKALTSR